MNGRLFDGGCVCKTLCDASPPHQGHWCNLRAHWMSVWRRLQAVCCLLFPDSFKCQEIEKKGRAVKKEAVRILKTSPEDKGRVGLMLQVKNQAGWGQNLTGPPKLSSSERVSQSHCRRRQSLVNVSQKSPARTKRKRGILSENSTVFGGTPLNLDTRGTKDEKLERSSLLHFKHREWKRLAGTPLTSTASPVEWSYGLSCLSTLVSAVRVFFLLF